MKLKEFSNSPKRLRSKWIEIKNAQGYSPEKILNGFYEIVSVHPFGITMRDHTDGLCSILWMQTHEDWGISQNQPRPEESKNTEDGTTDEGA